MTLGMAVVVGTAAGAPAVVCWRRVGLGRLGARGRTKVEAGGPWKHGAGGTEAGCGPAAGEASSWAGRGG